MKNRFVKGFAWLQVAARCFSSVPIVIEDIVIAVIVADYFLPKNVSHLGPRTAAAVSFRDRVAHLPILRTNRAFSEPLSRVYLAFNSLPSSQRIST